MAATPTVTSRANDVQAGNLARDRPTQDRDRIATDSSTVLDNLTELRVFRKHLFFRVGKTGNLTNKHRWHRYMRVRPSPACVRVSGQAALCVHDRAPRPATGRRAGEDNTVQLAIIHLRGDLLNFVSKCFFFHVWKAKWTCCTDHVAN